MIFLHIGLHKTGTKFLQKNIYPVLDSLGLIRYNPLRLTQLLVDLVKADYDDVDMVLKAVAQETNGAPDETTPTVISREALAGDLFSFYSNAEDCYSRLALALPEARLIMVFRGPFKWLISCYRESVHEHHYQSFAAFVSGKPSDKYVRPSIDLLDWSRLVALARLYFPGEPVFLHHEDLVSDSRSFISRLLSELGVGPIRNVSFNLGATNNRGYSALAILLSRARAKFLIWPLAGLVHRPIRFFGSGSIPAGFESVSVLPKSKYWGREWKRDNEEVRFDIGTNDSRARRPLSWLSWRTAMKRGLDRFVYVDWNVAGKLRGPLQLHFASQNESFGGSLGVPTESLPEAYRPQRS